MTEGIPAQFVFAADQGYEQAKGRLDDFITTLVGDMEKRPDTGDAISWASSVMFLYQNNAEKGVEIPTPLLEVWQAALYRLARQEFIKANSSG